MFLPNLVALVSFLLVSSEVSEAFSVSSRQQQTAVRTIGFFPQSTHLYSSESDTESKDPSSSTEEYDRSPEQPSSASTNDILNSPAFLKRKLEVLQTDVSKIDEDIEAAKARLEAGKMEWGSQLEDLEKEYKTIQQRMNDQSDKSDDQAIMQVTRQMLEVLDNFDRAFGQVKIENEDQQAIQAEYETVYNMFLATFAKLGVEEIKCVGTEFDYEVHQAVMQKPSDEYEEGIVCEEFQKGFKIGNTLIRASMVAVAA